MPKIVCFGETLWDIFPDKKVIGGAPLNVALRMHSLGADSYVISRIGKDIDGSELLKYLKKHGLNTAGIQLDPKLDTGNVQVHLDESNTASYTISAPVAWDEIETKPSDIRIISNADALIFGSLSTRSKTSRETLNQFLSEAKFKVFDANLRKPFYNMESIVELMHASDLIKLNDEELEEISSFLNFPAVTMEEQVKQLSSLTNTNQICVTLGADGAILYANGTFFKNSGYKVIVKDTVGAGDSFLASLVFHLIQGMETQNALDYSCAVGSLVASKNGATAKISKEEIDQIMS